MIISFEIKNWMSFRDAIRFSMVATKERQHGDRVPKVNKYQARILPIASIYGGNASGKTNLFKALNFVKMFVLKGTKPDNPINIDCFRLDSSSMEQPSSFALELLIDDSIYEFSFTVNRKSVISEKLVLVTSSNEKVLYERKNNEITSHHLEKKDAESDGFFKFLVKSTRENQLFLTTSIFQNMENFRPVYNWFKDSLELVAPDTRFEAFEYFISEEHPLYVTMNKMLPMLDTGIIRIGGEEIPFDNIVLPVPMKTKIQEELKDGEAIRLLGDPFNERFIVSRKDGKLTAQKMVTYHSDVAGNEIKFEMRQESDGSQRIIDLLPAFLGLTNSSSKKVFVIDEVERSLHTLLIRQLIELYLSKCTTESRSQLLFTTHDVLLMDQDLLRRDEMWVAERNKFNISTLFSFSEYKDIRYDKDIRKSYLQGRIGGIPRILLSNSLKSCSSIKTGNE